MKHGLLSRLFSLSLTGSVSSRPALAGVFPDAECARGLSDAGRKNKTIRRPGLLLLFAVVLNITGCRGCGGGGRTVLECSADFLCPSGLYCELGKDCGGIDRKGLCRPQPASCPHEEDNFCGCDGRDYPSVCYANGRGVTIAYPGKCMRAVPKK